MTEIEKALEDMCAEWGAVARLEPNRAALLAAITSAIEAARRDAPYAPAVIEAAEARGWERAREGCRRIAYNNEAEWVCEQIDALAYSPAPATPSALVGHLDNGSEVRVHLTQDTAFPTPPVPPERAPREKPPELCGGCAVRGLWEHRCHGYPCECQECTDYPKVCPECQEPRNAQWRLNHDRGVHACPKCRAKAAAPPSPKEPHDP